MQYELMYILPSNLTEEEAPQRAAKIGEILQSNGVQVTHETDMGKKKLAYPINHDRYGYYRLVEFSAEPRTLTNINNALRLSRELLRHQIIVKPVKSEVQIQREQALKEKLAARRAREEAGDIKPTAAVQPTSTLTGEELDKKIEEILEEEPNL